MGSLREISVARMISISEAWLDPKRDRPKFEALPSGNGLLEMIQSAHQGLLATQKESDPVSREVTMISEQQARLDKRHDRRIRAVFHLLNGFSEASDDPNEIADLLAARDELLPKGLSATTIAEAKSAVSMAMPMISGTVTASTSCGRYLE